MVRLACISLPKIDLQIVAQHHPEWKELPAAVVTEEKPLGRITAANRAAYAAGVQPGMRYGSALSICPELRAGVVQSEERAALREQLVGILRRFSPEIEPAKDDPALFWVNAAGLERIYGSPGKWAGSIEMALRGEGLVCSIAVGFSRFGTYAAAKVKRQITILESEDVEEARALRAPVGILPLDHEVLLRLQQLGIYTIRDFRRFAPGALRRRFGPEVERLQRFARGEEQLPVQAVDERPALRHEMRLLYPEASMDALLHHQLSLLRELVSRAWSQQQLVSELVLEFCPERWPGSNDECHTEQILTSKPTLDHERLARLLRLRLESLRLPAPVVRLSCEVRLLPTERAQDDLFTAPSRRDPVKALTAISELCAELGNDSVQVAELTNAHLPEEQFQWRRIERLVPPRPVAAGAWGASADGDGDGMAAKRETGGEGAAGGALPGPAVRTPRLRRILHEPLPLNRLPEEYHYPRVSGPYEFSGGWWQDSYRREYYYLQDRSGRLLWAYFDRAAEKWFVQGTVE